MSKAKEIIQSDNSIIFLTIFLILVWLLLDAFVGQKYIKRIISHAMNEGE